MAGRVTEVLAISALAAIMTAAIAAPVLRAPSERVFGMPIVGRHHDPFTVMQQFAHPLGLGVYSQPVTDLTGAALAKISTPVAGYNWLVLLSFPLSAAAALLLARYLGLSVFGATVAALAYAFSPFHLAHAAYHPQVAQTQWLPLYLLALWCCLDCASPGAIGSLAAATFAVTFSNFYGGLIALVITPVAIAAYWPVTYRVHDRPWRRLGITVGSLVIIAAAGIASATYAIHAVVTNRAIFEFSRTDLFLYSAKWWSYLVPPVEHPWFGEFARHVWDKAGVREGLLEQQVYLGWGMVALGLIAVLQWLRLGGRRAAPIWRVPVLALVAVTALLCSLSPARTIGGVTVVRPSALLYDVVPMFRSYARFGVAVQLMAALLAGIGAELLWGAASRLPKIVCVVLLTIATIEYAVAPSKLWRDALSTTAHRWVMRQAGGGRALDCAPLNEESESIEWLTGRRIMMGSPTSDCTEPNLAQKLAGDGYGYLLVQRGTADGQWFGAHGALDGLRLVANLQDGEVFAATARAPAIYTSDMIGFSPREHDAERSWQWMGRDAAWTVVSTASGPIVAALSLEMSAFHQRRHLVLRLDGRDMQTLVVDPARRSYPVGPIAVGPGVHSLAFHSVEAPTTAGDVIANGDRRALAFSFGEWNWTTAGEQP